MISLPSILNPTSIKFKIYIGFLTQLDRLTEIREDLICGDEGGRCSLHIKLYRTQRHCADAEVKK